jgi:hypothetical protein
MGRWMEKLRSKNSYAPTRVPTEPTKPTKAPSVGTVGMSPGGYEKYTSDNPGEPTKPTKAQIGNIACGSPGENDENTSTPTELPIKPTKDPLGTGSGTSVVVDKNSNTPSELPIEPTEGSSVSRSEVAHIYSHILDTELWIVPDGWEGELDGQVYTDSEIHELDGCQVTTEELRTLHRTKVELDGEIMRLSEADQLLQTIDPFDRDNYPGVGKVVELPDLDYEGRYTAHRAGSWPPEAIGHGDTVLEAVDELLALEDLESAEPR